MWKILQRRERKLEKACLNIYEKNKQVIRWFLETKCNLSTENAYCVMESLMVELRNHIDEIADKEQPRQCEWLVYQAYLIARRTFENVPEVYYEHKEM